MRDPYSILGVRRDAGSEEIKAAWRSKAKTSHPDHNQDDPGATQRFAEIGQAYDVLKDKDKRSRYDQRLSQMESMKREQTIMQQREEARAAALRAKQAKANADRIMADLARIEAERAKAEKAAEALNVKVEAARAKAKAAEAQASTAATAQASAQARSQASSQANAQTGSQTGSQANARANGQQAASGPGNSTSSTASSDQTGAPASGDTNSPDDTAQTRAADESASFAHHDEGKKPEDEAPAQSRTFGLPVIGLITSFVRRIRKPAPVMEKAPDITVEATIAVEDLLQQNTITLHLSDGRDVRLTLEPGHTDGSIVRMEGRGLKVPGMHTGDLMATLRVLRAGPFTVDGYDIHRTLTLPLEDAVLGCETQVEGPSGPINITIPPWSGSEQPIRLENLGLPSGPNQRGDLVVDLRIALSEKPNEKLRDLMKVIKHGLFL
ncbi:J domain-containing protein [Rhizobium oryziradicis]|uniref:Molecular chaperone DnaJ n=1 Tax=Rhizobium oryziradicis TaxID=1867956 RepID=A0A1Q8ZVG8_9HYPH|nr:DnaJ domain-containing protein [Rhizobium oryziradicis]OLP45888.1 molecular chaperone DnaJ [Rhizobium oryziradicis]